MAAADEERAGTAAPLQRSVDVSVLVPVLNEGAHLEAAAAAMLGQEFAGRLEFIFVDGGSSDGSLQLLDELRQRDDRVRVLPNPHRRTPHALNIGLRAAGGEFVARMDAHTLYPPNYLAAGVARLRRGDVGWVSGPQLPHGTDPGSERTARALRSVLGSGGAGFRRSLEEEVEVDSGFTGVWYRETLLRFDGWDEAWVNDQDLELAARMRAAGERIVCIPAMAARYVPRSSLRALARQYRTYGEFRVKTARRHPSSLRRSQLLPPAVVAAVLTGLVAPGRIGAVARSAAAVYGATIGTAGLRARSGGLTDALALPAAWATMHLSYGAGFWIGCQRYGPPIEAAAALAGRSRTDSA